MKQYALSRSAVDVKRWLKFSLDRCIGREQAIVKISLILLENSLGKMKGKEETFQNCAERKGPSYKMISMYRAMYVGTYRI